MSLWWMEILKYLPIHIGYSCRYRNIPIMYGNVKAMDESALQLLPIITFINTIRIYFLSGNMAELTQLCVGFENLMSIYNYGKALI